MHGGTSRVRSLSGVAVIAVALVAGVESAARAATCQQGKLQAAGRKTAGKLVCQATAVKLGTSPNPLCLSKVELKFASAFAKSEAKGGCPTTGDAGAVEAAVDGCVGTILSALGAGSPPPPPAACLQAKIKAAGKKAAGKLKCWAKAAATSTPVVPSCLTTAEAKFTAAFVKAELKTGCAQTGDAAAVEAAVDACVGDVLSLLPAGSGTTTTTSTPTTTTTTSSPSTTTTTLPACNGSEPGTLAGITAAQNDVRASASPAPVPALDPFCWNAAVAATAQAWADGCTYGHDPNLGTYPHGQNIYAAAFVGSPPPGWNPPVDAVAGWASEAADYDYGSNTCSAVCGHYTQIVWRDTLLVGCGIKECTANSPFGPGFPTWTYVVCNYAPPGNFIGQQPY